MKIAALALVFTACSSTRPAVVERPATLPATLPAPTAEVEPVPARFECPAIATPGATPEHTIHAELLRSLFTRLILAQPIDDSVAEPGLDWGHTAFGARVRALRACPRSYAAARLTVADEELDPRSEAAGRVSFAEQELGELGVEFTERRRPRGETAPDQRREPDQLVDLAVLEAEWARARLRSRLDARPDEVPSVTGSHEYTLALLRRPTDATLCIGRSDAEPITRAIPPGALHCYRIASAIAGARLLVHCESGCDDEDPPTIRRAWVEIEGLIFAVGDDAQLQLGGKAPRVPKNSWSAVGLARGEPGKPAGSQPVAPVEVPVADLSLAELISAWPGESTSAAGPVLTTTDLLCLFVDDRWRCADESWAREVNIRTPRVHAAVRGPQATVVPMELAECDGGSELSECTYQLHLLSVQGPRLRAEASLPLGAESDEHLRDVDDTGVTVHGTTDEYHWQYTVEAPRCVRMRAARRTHTIYGGRHGFGALSEDRIRRRSRPKPMRYSAAPAELPRLVDEIDVYEDPPDLRGLWQLRGERWVRVERCDP